MACGPSVPGLGVKITEQAAVPVVADAASVQVGDEKAPPPATLLAQPPTVPVGVIAVPASVSVTVAVHVVATVTGRGLRGEVRTASGVVRSVTVTELPPEPVLWSVSPS